MRERHTRRGEIRTSPRSRQTGTDGTTVFIYDQWGNVLYERSGSEYRDYIRAFGSSLVRIDGTIDSDVHTETSQYYYHTDHLGTVEAVTDASGTEVWSANYSAFGELLGTTGSLDQEAVYTGKDYDDEVGLYYFNARWYDPELGRFISEDPAQDGVNWYVYVSNNPLKFVDPTGLDPSYAGMSTEQVNGYYSGDDSDEGDGDNGESGNNLAGSNNSGQTTGPTPAPEPKKSLVEMFTDFLGLGYDEEGNKKKGLLEKIQNSVAKGRLKRATGGVVPDAIIDEWVKLGVTASDLTSGVLGIISSSPELVASIAQGMGSYDLHTVTSLTKSFSTGATILGGFSLYLASNDLVDAFADNKEISMKVRESLDLLASSAALRVPVVGLSYFYLDQTYGRAGRTIIDAGAKANAYYDRDPIGFLSDFYSIFDPSFGNSNVLR